MNENARKTKLSTNMLLKTSVVLTEKRFFFKQEIK